MQNQIILDPDNPEMISIVMHLPGEEEKTLSQLLLDRYGDRFSTFIGLVNDVVTVSIRMRGQNVVFRLTFEVYSIANTSSAWLWGYIRYRIDSMIANNRIVSRGLAMPAMHNARLTLPDTFDVVTTTHELHGRFIEYYGQFGTTIEEVLEKSKKLMLEGLSKRQRAQYEEYGYFFVVGSHTAETYKIIPKVTYGVVNVKTEDRYCLGFGGVESGMIPKYDIALMQALMISQREDVFLEKANVMNAFSIRGDRDFSFD